MSTYLPLKRCVSISSSFSASCYLSIRTILLLLILAGFLAHTIANPTHQLVGNRKRQDEPEAFTGVCSNYICSSVVLLSIVDNPHQIFACENANWGEPCQHIVNNPWGDSEDGAKTYCYQLDGATSAVGPDQGLQCDFYKWVSLLCTPLTYDR